MQLTALIFDVDGTLANTEREGHWPACNDAFAILDYPICWDWSTYQQLLDRFPGTDARMRHSLARHYPDWSAAQLDEASRRAATLKRQIYVEKYVSGFSLRPGIEKLITEAIEKHVRLAIVTLSHEAQARALLENQMPHALPYFDPILGKLAGPKTAPDSPLFRRCLAELGTAPEETLVIEDSAGGLKAARAAGLPCAVFYNDVTFGQDFAGAALVARSAELFDLAQLSALCLSGNPAQL